MKHEARPLTEITHEAFRILYRELGLVDTIRFLNQFTAGYGDYTSSRDELFGDMTVAEIAAAIRHDKGEMVDGE